MTSRPPDDGAGRFGDLPLQALERIAREWTHDLEPYWHDHKRRLGERLQQGVIPGYLDVRETVRTLREDADGVVAEKRARLERVIETACDDLAENREMEIGRRVAVILQVKR